MASWERDCLKSFGVLRAWSSVKQGEDAGSGSGVCRALVKGEELYIFRCDTGREELLAPFSSFVILPE